MLRVLLHQVEAVSVLLTVPSLSTLVWLMLQDLTYVYQRHCQSELPLAHLRDKSRLFLGEQMSLMYWQSLPWLLWPPLLSERLYQRF